MNVILLAMERFRTTRVGGGRCGLWRQNLNNDESNEQDGEGDKKADDLWCRPGIGEAAVLKSEDEAHHRWNEEKIPMGSIRLI
jgi:hypothetical protein